MERKEHFSRKRAAILETLRGTACHPTADWVYGQLKPRFPDLSLGTVYRNLHYFCETGQAVSLGAVGGFERFDSRTQPHFHLVCRRCGSVVDVFGEMPGGEELEELSRRNGCKIEGASVHFYGLCPECVKQPKSD